MEEDFDLKKWENAKWKLKDLYPQLTDSDLIWRHETKNALYNMIATKLLISNKEFSDLIDSL
ncbi:hypothetical protein OU798_01035 [Prolixibacteraceae bacterium Z1-6]|uniref:Uncharacterized protein n=1 Tax=Draconibacterium aestuarii TaxID=2998507 RepID=A0A9X3J5T1_9BACT|nr:hypothetical protein [Prolixibacteraceae bacterium Z1-6]